MKSCSIPECDGPHYAKGFCHSHYDRKRKTGDTGEAVIKRLTPRPIRYCSKRKCRRVHYALGLCRFHYLKARRAAGKKN